MAVKIVSVEFEGGQKSKKILREIALRLGKGGEVKVGFLENATYPTDNGGLPVATVAFWQEFGTHGKRPIPSRPYFRNMIEDQAETWGKKLGIALKMNEYRTKPALELLGADIKGRLVESINLLQDPPLAAYTVAKKGFAKPLIDTAVMVRAPAWVVKLGKPTT